MVSEVFAWHFDNSRKGVKYLGVIAFDFLLDFEIEMR